MKTSRDKLYQEIYDLRSKLTKMYEVNKKLNDKLKGKQREILHYYRKCSMLQIGEINRLKKENYALKEDIRNNVLGKL